MACECSSRKRGRWSNGGEAIAWAILARCQRETVELAEEFGEEFAGEVDVCAVTYKITWKPEGFASDVYVTLKKFSVGDDSWGPFRPYDIPGNPAQIRVQREKVQVFREEAECEVLPLAKLEFEKREGGGGAAGRTVPLGQIGDIKLCKLR